MHSDFSLKNIKDAMSLDTNSSIFILDLRSDGCQHHLYVRATILLAIKQITV